jgi:class 3 adenylate cyclase
VTIVTSVFWEPDGTAEEELELAKATAAFGAPEPKNLGQERLRKLMRHHDPFGKLSGFSKHDERLRQIRLEASNRLTDDFGHAMHTRHVVLSADIRKSTFLMKESTNLSRFAQIMTEFINYSRGVVAAHGGWFDKFMGDGFLAYWPCELFISNGEGESSALDGLLTDAYLRQWEGDVDTDLTLRPTTLASAQAYAVASCLRVAKLLIQSFSTTFLPQFRRTTRNFLSDTGLTVGLDLGEVLMVSVGGEMSIVGHPIVGAVRMTAEGAKGEIVTNTPVWAALRDATGADAARVVIHVNRKYDFSRRQITTKEYTQEAYFVTGNRNR